MNHGIKEYDNFVEIYFKINESPEARETIASNPTAKLIYQTIFVETDIISFYMNPYLISNSVN